MLATVIAIAENEIVEAKVLEVTEKGFVLQVGTEPLAVDDEHDSRFWRGKAVAKRSDFQPGDRVVARIKTDNDPPILRELAEKDTWIWLDAIRKRPQSGTVEKVDSRSVIVKFADGTRFAYRATEKSKVRLKGKPAASLNDLPIGIAVFLKGRTLPTYDTWLVQVSDEPIPLPASQTKESQAKKEKVPREPVLPESGRLTGHTLANLGKLSMFDVITTNNRALHISYTRQTKFTFEGRPCGPEAIERGLQFVLLYTRDRFGRIQATKVELYMRR